MASDDTTLFSEYIRRFGGPEKVAGIRADLFDKQLAFIDDKAKRKSALCSRRAGKTFGAACAYLVLEALAHPDALCIYIALSRKVARRLLWAELKRFDRKYDLGLTFNNTELEATFPNGAQVWLTGANNQEDIDKLRGSAYRLIVIDECASFGAFFSELVDEVLDPALADYDGTMALIGTPAAACTGLFYDVTNGIVGGWSRHSWTVLDNPRFPLWRGLKNWRDKARAWLAQKKKDKGWVDDDPVYLREWCARWVRSLTSLVYRFDRVRNAYDKLPKGVEWLYVLGIDLGYDDATAFSVLAFNRDHPIVYLVEDHTQSGMTTSDVAAAVKGLREHYKPTRIVADTGGLGKMIVEEMRKRHELPIEPAEKKSKRDFIELLNSDLLSGKLLAKPDSHFAQEAELLQWDEDGRQEDERFENHACDATLYAWRECRHYMAKPEEEEPPKGTPAAHEREAKAYERRIAARVASNERKPWFMRR